MEAIGCRSLATCSICGVLSMTTSAAPFKRSSTKSVLGAESIYSTFRPAFLNKPSSRATIAGYRVVVRLFDSTIFRLCKRVVRVSDASTSAPCRAVPRRLPVVVESSLMSCPHSLALEIASHVDAQHVQYMRHFSALKGVRPTNSLRSDINATYGFAKWQTGV